MSFTPLLLSYVSQKTNSTFFGEISEFFFVRLCLDNLWGVALPFSFVSHIYYMLEPQNTTILSIPQSFPRRKGEAVFVLPSALRHTLLVLSPSLDARREPSSCATDATQRLRCMENSA